MENSILRLEYRDYGEHTEEWIKRGTDRVTHYSCKYCPGEGAEPDEIDHVPGCPLIDRERLQHLGDGLHAAAAVLSGEADELAARRPHPDAHLYDVEEGLRHRAERARETLDTWYDD